LRGSGGLRARDFAIGFRPAVAIELPRFTHFLDFIDVQIRDN